MIGGEGQGDDDDRDIVWMSGVTTIRHEQRIEDDAIVFGSYINDVWNESHRMVFNGDKGHKAMALAALERGHEARKMSDTPRITHVYHWANGMTMVFDQHGKQMPEFQGVTDEMLPKLRAAGWPARRDVLDYYDDLTLQPWVREVAQPPSP